MRNLEKKKEREKKKEEEEEEGEQISKKIEIEKFELDLYRTLEHLFLKYEIKDLAFKIF